tara:strand:+ start:47 stop:526 length:480 start_codon:yes stop_codon:yes gene_type:complete
MKKLPREILDAVEDLYKNSQVDPREYPGVYIYWQGCGDSGGIDDILFMSEDGLNFAKHNDECPPRYNFRPDTAYPIDKMYACHTVRNRYNNQDQLVPIDGNTHRDITLDQWVYEHFDVCEINDGGFAHCFIEMPHGKVWGSSFNWVQTEQEVRFDRYED